MPVLLQKSKIAPGDNFPAIRQSDRQPPICVATIAFPRSPVSLSSGDEVPHIFTRKSRVQPKKLITSAKRLLQQNLPLPDSCTAAKQHSFDHLVGVGGMFEFVAGSGRRPPRQNLRLPHRNIGIRFTPVSRHYASEAIQALAAPFMNSLDGVPRAIQCLDRLSRKRGVAEPSTRSPPRLFPILSTPLAV